MTRWVEAASVARITEADVSKFMLDYICSRFGTPLEILSNSGSGFSAYFLNALSKNLSIKHVHSTPYYPQCNGLVEKTNGVLCKIITKHVRDRPQDWDKHLTTALWAYKTSFKVSTQFTPYHLVYGQEALLHIEVELGSLRVLAKDTTSSKEKLEQRILDLQRLEHDREAATDYYIAQANKKGEQFNNKVKEKKPKEGMLVMRTPTAVVHDMTLEEKFIGKKPDVSYFKVFGCIAYVHVPEKLRTKIDPNVEKSIFIGYSFEPKGADVNKSVAENSDAQSQVLSGPQGSPASSHVANQWSGRLHKEDMMMYTDTQVGPNIVLMKILVYLLLEPEVAQDVELTCFKEVAENDKWQEAMNEEMDALYGNETWELAPLPKGKKPIGCMDASTDSHDNVECQGSSRMGSMNSMFVLLPPTLCVEDVCTIDAGMDNLSQQGVLSFATTPMEDGLDILSAQPERILNGVVPQFSAILENVVDCAIPGHPSGLKHLCSLPLNLERGKRLIEIRDTTLTQFCAICHDKIKAEETAEIKGCEHSYCVTCILRWASYKTEPWCPQCRLPFSFLYVYRALDGSLSDYMFEESVCLLLRAFWFKPLMVQAPEEQDDYHDDYDAYEESYYTSSLRLGNRRWGDSGYVRAGRREARPVVVRLAIESSGGVSSSSRQAKGKEQVKEAVGQRARRAQKREQLDKMSGRK
ncbi:hypothetical protein L7F22_035683 [Adiantum nelumboides]|nr:hypothetical protein [Adiantum nelumboides]